MARDTWPPGAPPANRREKPNWTSGAKDGVGTAVGGRSRVWFTVAHGALTEVYFPRIDQANTRDVRLVVTGRDGFFSDEVHDTDTSIAMLEPGVPAYRIRQRCRSGRYMWDKMIVTDDRRPAVLMRARLVRHENADDLRAFVLVAPHIRNRGSDNDAWVDHYKGMQIIAAQSGNAALVLACSVAMKAATCTFVGEDDAWHDLRAHGELTMISPHAFGGNVLVGAELDCGGGGDEVVLTLAFGDRSEDAAVAARASLAQPFDDVARVYATRWKRMQARCRPLAAGADVAVDHAYRTSVAVLRVHEDKDHPGGYTASLGIPWGQARGDDDRGGYHLMWPRDVVEIAGGLLAAGLEEPARLALVQLISTQEAEGHWPQNMWLDGRSYWRGVQLDEAGLPILLADALRRRNALGGLDPWPMVHRAAGYIVRNGPASPEDRWEEHVSFSPYTLAVEVAALRVAAKLADLAGQADMCRYLVSTARAWDACIERWTFARDSAVAKRLGISGYYARAAKAVDDGGGARVTVDALGLVRFGLRDANDPRVRDTIRAIDAVLETETDAGPVWHRFDGDTYGEEADGSAFAREGIGRGWPLLAGERAHYELARGDRARALELRRAMLAQAGRGGLFPEQVWDAADIPEHGLYNGRPTGSAMPLAWAHAEYIKLCRSLDDGRVFDAPPESSPSRGEPDDSAPLVVWRKNMKRRDIPAGATLRLEFLEAHAVRWRVTERGSDCEAHTAPSGLGTHFIDLPTSALREGDALTIHTDDTRDSAIEIRVTARAD